MNRDGSNLSMLREKNQGTWSFLFLHVVNDWMIFRGNDGLYRMNADGGNLELLAEVEHAITAINIYDDWIFYHYFERIDGEQFGQIYKVRIDGTEHTFA
jgi:hypothetical protein